MFRIHINRGSESTSLTIEGKLTGPWVRELEKCWRAELSADSLKPIEVHLAAVLFVDVEGRELLMRMRREHATLVARGCLMKSLVEGIEMKLSGESSAGDAP
ncbi:MAG TPA: hypothetical protein VLM38_10395 [Blastocatellia bacterium]|nr:hypothetical protein [Blastocatellia bacterium]